MYPVGTYESFKSKVRENEDGETSQLFGVLFLNYNQQETKGYIIDYLDIFHNSSGSHINFYLPGYIESKYKSQHRDSQRVEIGKKKYCFSIKEYNEIANLIKENFGIGFPFRPTLIIFEVGGNQQISGDKFIEKELLNKNSSASDAGDFIQLVIEFSKKKRSMKEMKNGFFINDLVDYAKNEFVDDLDIREIKIGKKLLDTVINNFR